MEELSRAVSAKIETEDPAVLTDAACRWANHALKNYAGRGLRLALAISAAMVAFEDHYKVKVDDAGE